MNAALILGIIAAIFGLASLLLRSNAVFMFFALCAGSLLAESTAKDVTQVVNSVASVNIPTFSIVQIILLTIAPLIILIIYRKSSGAGLLLHIVPALAFAVLLFMTVTSMLPYDLQAKIQDSSLYGTIKPYYGVTVAAGLLASIFYLWSKKPRHDKHDKKHK